MKPAARLAALLLALAPAPGCRSTPDAKPAPAESDDSKRDEPEPSEPPVPSVDLLSELWRCEVFHHGLILDLGEDGVDYRRGYSTNPPQGFRSFAEQGASYEEISSRRARYELWVSEGAKEVEIVARLKPGRARRIYFRLGKSGHGAVRVTEEEPHVLRLGTLGEGIAPGRHQLELSFVGGTGSEPYLAFDWLRVGPLLESNKEYSAPTANALYTDVVLGEQPKRSLALPSPAVVRCPLVLGTARRLSVSLGVWGSGRATAEARLVREGEPARKLFERELDAGAWTRVDVDLPADPEQLVALEFVARSAESASRVAFGEPRLTLHEPPRKAKNGIEAKTAIVVVLAGARVDQLPPWGPAPGLGTVARIASRSTAFSDYRAPSAIPAAAVASVLTGLPPAAHALGDSASRLPRAARTLATVLKETGCRTAMFTGVPTTFEAFGFNTGWDRFEMISPVVDESAGAPLSRAADWLEESLTEAPDRRRFAFVHLRGAHPPWDVGQQEASKLAPEDYSGLFDPRRGGIALNGLRARRHGERVIGADDWVRLGELAAASLGKQDAAFERLLEVLVAHEALDSSLIVIMGDVGAGDRTAVPFDPDGALADSRLLVPLLVQFPEGGPAGESSVRATAEDVAVTVLRAFGIPEPADWERWGTDLFELSTTGPLLGRVQWATRGDSYLTRFGPYRLTGSYGKTPSLCRFDVDPACVENLYDRSMLAARSLWQLTHRVAERAWAPAARVGPREAAGIDPMTGAALTVWGDIP
jgi:hypothetical protein